MNITFLWDNARVKLLGYMVITCFILLKNAFFSEWLDRFTSSKIMYEWSSFSASLPAFDVTIFFFYFNHFGICIVIFHCGLDVNFPHSSYYVEFFHMLIIYASSLVKYL